MRVACRATPSAADGSDVQDLLRIENLGYLPALVDRDELVAQIIIGRM